MTPHEVWYGDERVGLASLPAAAIRVLGARAVPGVEDPIGVVAAALDHPLGAPCLADAARGVERVTVVVPDAARRCGAAIYLLPVLARLAQARHGPRSISVLVARGVHPALAREEVRSLVGEDVMAALHVVQSAPDAPEFNVALFEDEDIGPVRVHRLVAEAGLVLLTGAVVPHHLAGFGGGAKALVPGVADRATVEAAHRLTLRTVLGPDGSLRSQAGRLEANPFRDALLRVAERHGRCFLLNVVLDAAGRPAAAAAGAVREAHEAATDQWRALHGMPPVPEPADLVVVGAGPVGGRDLIQAHKALLAAAAWAKPGAPIVWLARAPRGPGHPDLLPWFQTRTPERHLAALRRGFQPQGLVAYSIRRIAGAHPVHVVSEVSRDLLLPMGLLPAPSPAAALERALGGRDLGTIVLFSGP